MSDPRPGVRPRLEVVRDDEHAAQLAAKHKAGYAALSAFTSAEWVQLSGDARAELLARRVRALSGTHAGVSRLAASRAPHNKWKPGALTKLRRWLLPGHRG